MSKLIKSLKKIKKKIGNCLVLGNAWGNLSDLVASFDNVFIFISDDQPVRGRNVIYRDNFKDPTLFSNINFVFIDSIYIDEIEKTQNIITFFRPVILLGSGEYISLKREKYLMSLGYILDEKRKTHQVWKLKGKK